MKNSILIFILFTTFNSIPFIVHASDSYDETKINLPITDSNEEFLMNTICKTKANLGWDLCFSKFQNGDEKMKSFTFTNLGENKIVPKSGFGIGRDFEFMFEGFARSDLGLLIWDSPDEFESHGHLKLMMFFPRIILPSIRLEKQSNKDVLIVTLPTKEEVIFNYETKEIIGGILSEAPIRQDSQGRGRNPEVSYQGIGVVVEADSLADYPVGFRAQSNKAYATISKKGFKSCKIPVKDLWYTDENKSGNVFFNKQYITDNAFDSLLKSKCHFSIY